MVSARIVSALLAVAIFQMASADSSSSSIDLIPTPTGSVVASAFTEVGCFSTAVPLEDHGPYTFQSLGNCQLICTMLDKPVLGLVDGTNCWCGDKIPPKDSQVSNSSCDTNCAGIKTDKCGGPSMWWITLTGITQNRIDYYDPASASSSSITKSSTSADAVKTSANADTIVVTATNSPDAKKSSGPNTTGIAVGVVVGVLVLAAIIGGVVLFLRRKRRQQVEEDYRRQAAISSFTAGGKLHTSNSSMTDSRLDPEFMNRRASNGSIADNEDYSRRILKVTNA